MKCIGADVGAFAGSGVECTVQCTVCSVLPATDEDLVVKTVYSIKSLSSKINFLKPRALVYF